MSIIQELQEKLKEKQWTRASLDEFNIQDLDELIANIVSEKKEKEALDICLEFMENSSKIPTALYLIGFLAYEIDDKENTLHLRDLFEIFKENKKMSLVLSVAEKILEKEPNNIYIMQNLLAAYTDLKKEKERLNLLIQLVKIDTKNGQIAQQIGEYYESHPEEDVQNAKETPKQTRYYQLALRRYAKNQNLPKVEEMWKKLVQNNHDKINFFLNIALTVAENNAENAIGLFFNLLETLEQAQKIDQAIYIAKKIIDLDPNNSKIREKVVALYTEQYKDHSQMELCLENSKIKNSNAPILQAMKKFEKEIAFQENRCVAHKTWGIGMLTKIEDGNFVLDFDDKKNHRMSYAMALNALTALDDEHIWVLKKFNKIEKLETQAEITYILLAILKSFSGKNLSVDDFKDELSPDIIPTISWNSWWNKAKEVLKSQPSIGTLKEGRPKYFIRSIEINFEEELIEKFHLSRKFDEKIKLFEKFKKDVSNLDAFADEFKEMVAYFEKVLHNPKFDFNDRAISFVILKKIEQSEPWAIENEAPSINDFMDEDNLLYFLTQNHKVDYKKDLIQLVLKYHPKYLELLEEILFHDRAQIADFLMEQLEKELSQQDISHILELGVHNIFRENPIMTIWFLKYLLTKERYQTFGFKVSDLYIEVLYRIDTLGKIAAQKKLTWFKNPITTVELKKILTSANNILFSDTEFVDFISQEKSEKYISKIFQLIKSSLGLNPKKKLMLMKTILEQFSHLDQEDTLLDDSNVNIDYLSSDKVWTSQSGLEKQHKKILALQKERTDNLLDLESAREKGDLRENSEYQAAREKDSLLNTSISELGEQIHKASVIDLSDISGDRVIPGTIVSLERNKQKETYTILGFWDTDEKNNVIAYNSPLAKSILGASKNDVLEVEIGGQKTTIKILDIKAFKGKI